MKPLEPIEPMDRPQFFASTHEELRLWQLQQMKAMPIAERVSGYWQHTCRVYGIDPQNPPPFDKTVFSMRKHERQ